MDNSQRFPVLINTRISKIKAKEKARADACISQNKYETEQYIKKIKECANLHISQIKIYDDEEDESDDEIESDFESDDECDDEIESDFDSDDESDED